MLVHAGADDAEETLFEDAFEGRLSKQWQPVGLKKEDYRIRDGTLEIRLQTLQPGGKPPMLKVDLPFTTADSVRASVDVSIEEAPLGRGEFAGLCLTDTDGADFSGKKANIDGYRLFTPSLPEFIGKSGQEGDPGKYTVKYWPADKEAGPLNIIVRQHNAHFQVGPSQAGKYMTFFESAITKAESGLGFGLIVGGCHAGSDQADHWVRFDNFRVMK